MIRLPRRLALWGGAAAIAAGGFAFMASSDVAGSSLGDGAGTASGYTVTTVHWSTAQVTYISADTNYVTGVSFKITSDAKTAPANERPSTLNVYLVLSTGEHELITAPSTCGYVANNFFGSNVATHWLFLGTGEGYGTVTVSLNIRSCSTPPKSAIVTGITVEANT